MADYRTANCGAGFMFDVASVVQDLDHPIRRPYIPKSETDQDFGAMNDIDLLQGTSDNRGPQQCWLAE